MSSGVLNIISAKAYSYSNSTDDFRKKQPNAEALEKNLASESGQSIVNQNICIFLTCIEGDVTLLAVEGEGEI